MPGAGGITGTQAIVKAAPDGTTIGVVSNNHVINPSVYKKMPFDSINDITPIMLTLLFDFRSGHHHHSLRDEVLSRARSTA